MTTNNAINLSSQGVAYYNGTGSFSGLDGGTAGNILTSNGTGVASSFQPIDNANLPFHYATYLVHPTSGMGDFTTIAAALAVAISGDTIALYPATYVENLTYVAGVSITTWGEAAAAIIQGQGTINTDGNFYFYGLTFSISGTQSAIINGFGVRTGALYLEDCNIQSSSSGYAFFLNSNASSTMLFQMTSCSCNVSGQLISFGAGTCRIFECLFSGAGNVDTYGNYGTSNVLMLNSYFNELPFQVVGAFNSNLIIHSCTMITAGTNTTPITFDSGNCQIFACFINSGTAASIAIVFASGGGFCCYSFINSSAANAITGPGNITISTNTYSSTSSTSISQQGSAQGVVGSGPYTGFLGQRINSYQGTGTPTTGTDTTLVSVTLTPGTWDISAMAYFTATTFTNTQIGISTTTNSLAGTVSGDSYIANFGVAGSAQNLVIPSYRQTITTNTTYYLVVNTTFVGGINVAGRITAVRTG